MRTGQVFSDPSGRRWRVLKWLGAVLAATCAFLATVFVVSLLLVPLLPTLPDLSRAEKHGSRPSVPALAPRQARIARFLLRSSRSALWREISASDARATKRAAAEAPEERGIVAAFYAPWQETGLHSLRANAGRMTHVMPEWLHLDRAGASLDTSDWDPAVTPHNLDVVEIAREHHLQVHPILNNAEAGEFDPGRVHRLLLSTAAQDRLAASTREWLLSRGFSGLNLDFENLEPEDYGAMAAFVERLAPVLRGAGLRLSVDVEAGRPQAQLARMARAADFLVLMAYDEHYEGGEPGPIASAEWSQGVLLEALKAVPASRLVAGIGSYAYDWREGRPPADAISYQSAMILARDNRPDESPDVVVDFDASALNPTFTYHDEEDKDHVVWILDGATVYNQWLMARRAGISGAALWSLGSEDPSLWEFLDKGRRDRPPLARVLERVSFPYDVEFEGEGEILSVLSTPQEGRRRIESDEKTGLVVDESYLAYPSSFVIRRSGYRPGKIVLTFDDGPDPEYTPAVLDALKRWDVRAAFFVIGQSAERYPGLVQREWREGHEIGSHTFTHPNMGAIGSRRAALELNATQRALESVLGRSTILFRAPYNADAEPESAEEVRPIEMASELGYLTVGERIDPQDWNLYAASPDGSQVRRTASDLVSSCLAQLQETRGNVVLLHDGGGDRSQTVKTLDLLIPALRKAGYQFATISELAGRSRDEVMPPFDRRGESLLVGADRVVFELLSTAEAALSIAFFLAIVLGIGRVAFLVPLALAARRRARRAVFDPAFKPAASALIAAFNEEKVIARTVGSILASSYPVSEVIVVDDGSSDATTEAVLLEFDGDTRVRVICQENAGKASALNRAAREAHGEVLLCLDADTQIAPDALGLLVRHFEDSRVAAVAGNVKVGNKVNLLTRWQSIEYITSQNLDRRAYALLNAITVVPGAIGAWRREAVLEAGGYSEDSLAEDMDLTWRLRRSGNRVAVEEGAVGLTEAPESLGSFVKQRFRWTFGTLQCLWKHRGALLRYGWFGWLALPSMWLFQVAFQALSPLADLQVLYSLSVFFRSWLERGVYTHDWQPLPQAAHALYTTLFFYALFFAVELFGASVAFLLDREKLSSLWWLFLQRLAYRQVMYTVLFRSLLRALQGARQGWGKLERQGSVRLP